MNLFASNNGFMQKENNDLSKKMVAIEDIGPTHTKKTIDLYLMRLQGQKRRDHERAS